MTDSEKEWQKVIYEREFAKQNERTDQLVRQLRKLRDEMEYKRGYEDGKRDAVRHGEWDYNDIIDSFECSVCGEGMVRNVFNFCPWCGAKMDGGAEPPEVKE